jgi:hypothetical protein
MGSFTCQCAAGFTGITCLDSVSGGCQSSPCENGATCVSDCAVDTADGYRQFTAATSYYQYPNIYNEVSFAAEFSVCFVSISYNLLIYYICEDVLSPPLVPCSLLAAARCSRSESTFNWQYELNN